MCQFTVRVYLRASGEADRLARVLSSVQTSGSQESMVVMMADIVCPVVRADVTCYWKDMWRRLDAMRRLWQLCDVRLRTDDGASFMAHSPVLAASSDVLHHMLVAARHETFADGPGVVPVHGLTPDVLRITLDFIYGVTPTSRADFERLRVGASRLGIEGAYEYCNRRLGDSTSGFLHPQDAAGPAAEATAATESHCTVAVPDELTSAADEVSTGCQNLSDRTTSVDAGMSELPRSADEADGTLISNDVPHAAMMAHMSLADLARSDECPHLRQLAGGEILPTPILAADDCLEDDSSGSLDDGCGFLDSVPLKKRIRNSQPSDSDGSGANEDVSKKAVSQDTLIGDVDSHSLQSSAQHSCPPTFLVDSIGGAGQCDTVSHAVTTSDNIAAGIDFSNPLYAAADFPSVSILKSELVTQSPQDCSISYIADCYAATCMSRGSGEWTAGQQLGTAAMTSNLLPPLTTCMQPLVADTFASILSTTDVLTTDITAANSVSSSVTTSVNGTADMLGGYPQDVNFTDFGVLPSNPWQSGDVAIGGEIPAGDLVPADNSVAYFNHSPVVSSIPQFVPTVNPSTSSSSLSSVAAAGTGSNMADLSYISLDDVSAVLKANGFSDKTSSSPSDVTAVNHTTHTGESCDTADGENHTSSVNKAGTRTTVNQSTSTSSGARVCIFCQKPCKSER